MNHEIWDRMKVHIGWNNMSILREWDHASTSRRIQVLQWFVARFNDVRYSDELENECGSEISLLLPRIVVWMDKTKRSHKPSADPIESPSPLEEQLASIQLFLTSANSHKYFREFVQAEGIRVLLQVLETDVPPHHYGVLPHHRCMIYTVLSRIAQRGREWKQQISLLHGELAMVRGAIATIEHTAKPAVNLQSRVWMTCRMTLLEQMNGNHTCVDSSLNAITFMLRHDVDIVRIFGAQVLRELINERSFFLDDNFRRTHEQTLIPLSVELLQSSSIPLQHEGLELVHSLLQMPSTRKLLCMQLAKWIHNTAIEADPIEPAFVTMKDTREYDMYIHLRSSFVHAAQSLATLMHSVPPIVPFLVQTHEVLIPMAFVLTIERSQSIKWHAAITVLHFIFNRCRDVAANHLCQLFLVPNDSLLTLPHHVTTEGLANELLRDDDHRQVVALNFFQNGWVRTIAPPSSSSNSSVLEPDESVDASLAAIEYDVDAAVHRVLPPPLVFVPCEGEGDVDSNDMDFATENHLRERLERHFMKFRQFSTLGK